MIDRAPLVLLLAADAGAIDEELELPTVTVYGTGT